MKCRLCLQEKRLQKESHIIPNFMYDELISEGNGFFKIHKTKKSKFRKPKKIYSGEYDLYILCHDCDNGLINRKYETYASNIYRVLSGKLPKSCSITISLKVNPEGIEATSIKGIDYKKFKLFLLSVLWRSSITKRPQFSDVKLGKYESVIRKMILFEDAKGIEDFPFFMLDLRKDEPALGQMIEPPKKIREKGNISYLFQIAGIAYQFFVSKNNLPPYALASVSKSGNEVFVYHAPSGVGKEYLEHIKRSMTRR